MTRRAHPTTKVVLLVAVVVAALIAIVGASGCARDDIPAATVTRSTPSPSAVATSSGNRLVPDITQIRVANPGDDVRVGGLVARLAAVGGGPADDIEHGPASEPTTWTTRLSVRIEVRNEGSAIETVTLSPDWPVVLDAKGHHRAPFPGSESLKGDGFYRPLSDAGQVPDVGHKLKPGGWVAATRSFWVRKDDRTRLLWVNYQLNDTTMLRFRLAPSKPPLF